MDKTETNENPNYDELDARIRNMIQGFSGPSDVEPILKEISNIRLNTLKYQYASLLASRLGTTISEVKKDLQRYTCETLEEDVDAIEDHSEEEIDKAREILKSPNILTLVLNQIEKFGHVGESLNKIAIFLAFISRLLVESISIVVKGGSASGKNSLVKAVLNLFPKSTYLIYTAISSKALYYLKNRDLSHTILVVTEAHGSEQADYSIRSSISEGCLRMLVTIKNPFTNMFESQEIEIPAEGMVYIETTTKSHLHAENQTRLFDLYVDESAEQTREVLKAKVKLIDVASIARENRIFQACQTLLKPYVVHIPFGEVLAQKFPTKKVRSRRDFPRFLSLIKATTLLHQYQRETTIINGNEYLVASINDYEIAYEISKEILSQTLKEVSPVQEKIVMTVREKFLGREFAIRNLRQTEELKNIPDSSLRGYVKELANAGYFEWNEERGKNSRYKLVDMPKDFLALPSPEELYQMDFSSSAQSEKARTTKEISDENRNIAQYDTTNPNDEYPAKKPNQAENSISLNNPLKSLEDLPSSSKAGEKHGGDNTNIIDGQFHTDQCDCEKCEQFLREYWANRHGSSCDCNICSLFRNK